MPNLASQMRTAFASMAWNTGSSSPGELLMTRSTSDDAVCCSSASASFLSSSVGDSPTWADARSRLRPGRTKPANALFGSSPPCETRSPRRHSHWSPSGRAQPGIEPVNPNRTARELAALHSITSSARASSVGGTSRPSAFAVLRLITRSNLVGCSTGISAGFAPRRILSVNSAARRKRLGKFVP